jgi:protein arginine N-methyltransferase 1
LGTVLDEHLRYISDWRRLELFRTAISAVVRPGDTIVDLGCGSGILGLLCLKAGASHVYAIEESPVIEIARRTYAREGMAELATFVRGMSHRTILPKRAAVVICDHIGCFGFDYGIVHTLRDARSRFLAPNGTLIPRSIRLNVAAVESDAARAKVERWSAPAVPEEFRWLRRLDIGARHAIQLQERDLLSTPAHLADLDLSADNADFLRWTASLSITREGVMDGIAGWFDCELTQGVWMTNSPADESAIDRPQAFLPIDDRIRVRPGDRVLVTIMARPVENIIAWTVDVLPQGLRYAHSSLEAALLSAEAVRRTRPDRVPRIGRNTSARMTVLSYCDERRTAREIEQAILSERPDLLPSRDETARFASQVLAEDTDP